MNLDFKKLKPDFKNLSFIDTKAWIFYIVTFIAVLGGDLLTKHYISNKMQLMQSQTFIDNFFYFTYVKNEGGAWSMLSGNVWLFILVAIIVAVVLVYFFTKTKPYQKLSRYGMILILGGLLGNLFDRLFFGFVRDFIDFVIFGYNFPIFNIADMGIVIGVLLLIFEVVFEEKLSEKYLSKSK